MLVSTPSKASILSGVPQWLLAQHFLPFTLTACTCTERPPLCLTPWPSEHGLLQHRHLRPHRRCRLTRRRILLLPHHRTETRSARTPLNRRTEDRALISRPLSFGASKDLPRRRPRLRRPEARIRRRDQPQHEKISLRPSQQR